MQPQLTYASLVQTCSTTSCLHRASASQGLAHQRQRASRRRGSSHTTELLEPLQRGSEWTALEPNIGKVTTAIRRQPSPPLYFSFLHQPFRSTPKALNRCSSGKWRQGTPKLQLLCMACCPRRFRHGQHAIHRSTELPSTAPTNCINLEISPLRTSPPGIGRLLPLVGCGNHDVAALDQVVHDVHGMEHRLRVIGLDQRA